jgi:hypothetical protein
MGHLEEGILGASTQKAVEAANRWLAGAKVEHREEKKITE